ncbi:MAG: protein-ADP-ribose hydrolase, partial [Tissierellia bacterium]|nr:protein-ADP-ribose hydrolase [Tissierellia bacterium]
MDQRERRLYLIRELLREQNSNMVIPEDQKEQEKLLRALMNERRPAPITPEFERIQNEYLNQFIGERGITRITQLQEIEEDLYLWRGDITTLEVDGIVNAANKTLLGCFIPGHHCIDNAIQTFAGIQLRLTCDELVKRRGYEEPTGSAVITSAFNLPSRYVIHTVGPIVDDEVTKQDRIDLKSCYQSCLELADEQNLSSLALCSISTGAFGFPKKEGAQIAVDTVREYKKNSSLKIVFNVYSEEDEGIYRELL